MSVRRCVFGVNDQAKLCFAIDGRAQLCFVIDGRAQLCFVIDGRVQLCRNPWLSAGMLTQDTSMCRDMFAAAHHMQHYFHG